MKITKHGKRRMQERGIDLVVVDIVGKSLPIKYRNQSCRIILDHKTINDISRDVRKFLNKIEKHSGMELVLDPTGETLITTYRKMKRHGYSTR